MPDVVLTKYAGQLRSRLVTARRSRNAQGEETGVQRVGIFTSNVGDTITVYYDPSAHELLWDNGTPSLNQQ